MLLGLPLLASGQPEAQSGGSTIKSGLDMLQKAMMGNLPGQPAVDAAVAQLQ